MVYAAETDPLCYPGTTILKNLADLTDQGDLDQYELSMFLTRADEELPAGGLDYPHYLALHHHLFQDVYEWAGKPRVIRIGKGRSWFCYPEHIDREMNRTFGELADEGHLQGLAADAFAARAAHYLAEINAVHPFREGNGRTQLVFLTLLAENAGFAIDADGFDRDRVLQAMIDSFVGREAPLSALIRDLISHHG